MLADLKSEIDEAAVAGIFAARSIGEVKVAVAVFLAAAEEVRDIMNGMHVYMLCHCLGGVFAE